MRQAPRSATSIARPIGGFGWQRSLIALTLDFSSTSSIKILNLGIEIGMGQESMLFFKELKVDCMTMLLVTQIQSQKL